MTDKTPITILQELCVANATQPLFNLIHDGTGAMKPIFKYEVSVTIKQTNVKAIGTGRSKKEAKHDSARLALEKLTELKICKDKSPTVSEVEPLPRFVASDAIRNLFELCDERKLPMPEYELIQDVGPPHARQFTMMCSVASLKQNAVATTKKAAKQLSALNMIDLLKTVENSDIRDKEVIHISQVDAHRICEQRYEKTILTRVYKEFDSPFKNYDSDKCSKAISILSDPLLSPEEKWKNAVSALELEYNIQELPAKNNQKLYLLSLRRVEPDFFVSDMEMEGVFKRANKYMLSFLT